MIAASFCDLYADRSTGSRVGLGASASASTFTWDPQGRISSSTGVGGGSYAFTASGQVTKLADGSTLTYDGAGQLAKVSTPATPSAPAVSMTYTYDGRGERVAAATTTAGSAATSQVSYTYDLAGQLTSLASPTGTSTYSYDASGLRETTTTAAGTQRFTWDALAGVPALLSDGSDLYVYGLGTTPLAQVDAITGAVEYLHADLIGSVRMLTNTAGAIVADSDYTAYGQPLAVTSSTVSVVSRFGYAGSYSDPTGLLYLRARYYDPASAQFLTLDPLLDLTHNPYGYTGGNPLQMVDPLGLFDIGGFLSDTWSGIKGVGQGIGDLAYSMSPLGIVDTVRGLPDAYREGGGGWGGIGLAVNQFNPVYGLLTNVSNGWDLANQGCVQASARAFTGATFNLAATIGLADGAGKAVSNKLGAGAAAGAVARRPAVIRVGDVNLPGVPKGATGTLADNGTGLIYQIPSGTPELDPRVTQIRIMDPTTTGLYPYPNGYAVYMNELGQRVNPLTGQTISSSDPFAHLPLP